MARIGSNACGQQGPTSRNQSCLDAQLHLQQPAEARAVEPQLLAPAVPQDCTCFGQCDPCVPCSMFHDESACSVGCKGCAIDASLLVSPQQQQQQQQAQGLHQAALCCSETDNYMTVEQQQLLPLSSVQHCCQQAAGQQKQLLPELPSQKQQEQEQQASANVSLPSSSNSSSSQQCAPFDMQHDAFDQYLEAVVDNELRHCLAQQLTAGLLTPQGHQPQLCGPDAASCSSIESSLLQAVMECSEVPGALLPVPRIQTQLSTAGSSAGSMAPMHSSDFTLDPSVLLPIAATPAAGAAAVQLGELARTCSSSLSGTFDGTGMCTLQAPMAACGQPPLQLPVAAAPGNVDSFTVRRQKLLLKAGMLLQEEMLLRQASLGSTANTSLPPAAACLTQAECFHGPQPGLVNDLQTLGVGGLQSGRVFQPPCALSQPWSPRQLASSSGGSGGALLNHVAVFPGVPMDGFQSMGWGR